MKLLIFDGNSILNRAYYAIHALSTKDGRPTNGIFGFLKLYHKYLTLSEPDMVAVAFDLRAPTFRHRLYADYKAQRKGMPDELAMQLDPLKEILRAMNISILELEGYEADDVIGTASRFCLEQGFECDIVSGDRDDFQLLGKGIRLMMPVTRGGMSEMELYDEAALREKYGLVPAVSKTEAQRTEYSNGAWYLDAGDYNLHYIPKGALYTRLEYFAPFSEYSMIWSYDTAGGARGYCACDGPGKRSCAHVLYETDGAWVLLNMHTLDVWEIQRSADSIDWSEFK